jgi:uncharacterized protein (DUF1697 family)
MPRHIALLRAINVGGHVVKMDRLRTLFEELGFENVETFIASGNVLFDAPRKGAASLEARIEAHLRAALGYDVATFVRTPAELEAVVAYRPFGTPDPTEAGANMWVAFLRAPIDDAAREQLLAFRTPTDEFHTHGREAYWLCRTRFSDSPVKTARLEKTLGPSTMRNVTTVRKLAGRR